MDSREPMTPPTSLSPASGAARGRGDLNLDAAAREGLAANVRRFLAYRGIAPGEFVELQALNVPGSNPRFADNLFAHAGDVDAAVRLLEEADKRRAPGVYVIANRVDPAVATRRAAGRWHVAQKGESTTDKEITARCLLFVDIDADRPKGTSSTDEQLAATDRVAVALRSRLVETLCGVVGAGEKGAADIEQAIAIGHSGNGCSVFVALADLPETPELSATIKGILAAARELFEAPGVKIDPSVSDAKRLVPAFGTMKRKGAEDIAERPHRRSSILCAASPRRLTAAELDALLVALRSGFTPEQSDRVEKAMGRRPPPAVGRVTGGGGVNRPGSQFTGPDVFRAAKEIPVDSVLGWLGLGSADDPTCPGCGLSGDSSVAVVGNGLKCSHARCADLGVAGSPGFRTTIDIVCEVMRVEPKEAVALMADQFGTPRPGVREPSANQRRTKSAEDSATPRAHSSTERESAAAPAPASQPLAADLLPSEVAAIVEEVRAAGEGAANDASGKQARQTRAAEADVVARIASIPEGSPDGLRLRRELSALGVSAGALRASLKWHRDQRKAQQSKREQAPSPVDPDARRFRRGDQSELATATLEVIGTSPLTFDAGEFFRYAPDLGIWEIIHSWRVRSTAETFAGCPVGPGFEPLKISASTTMGVESLAKDRLQSVPDRVTFEGAPAGIAFANGFVTVVDGQIELLPHDPEHRARFAYPFNYDPEAKASKLDTFLGQLFADVDKYERDLRIALLQEFIGACLIGEATRYQRYLILFATGGNGKSELLRVARGIFPPGAVTSLPPQSWGDQFKTIMLEGKRANFVDELPDGEIMSGSSVKLVVTGEPVPGEQKRQPAFIFRPIAGHIFATNSPIRSTDQSEGFWRRPLVLPLTRRFDEAPERVLEAGQAVLDAELPGVVTWALYGAARAQAQKGYTLPPSSVALAMEWRGESDQIRTFVAEKPIAAGGRVQASTLYDTYREWAKGSGHAPMSSTMFGRRLMAAGLYDRESGSPRFYVRRGAISVGEAMASPPG